METIKSSSLSAQADHIGDANKKVSPITQPLIAEAARDDVDWPAAMADARFVYEFLPDAISAIDYIQAIVDNQPKKAIAAVQRDDVAGDAERLSNLFSMLPLSDFCCAYDIPIPNTQIRDFSVWAKSVIDAAIAATPRKTGNPVMAAAVKLDDVAGDVLIAAKDFYNKTMADPDVRISTKLEERRDAIIISGQVLRAAIAASTPKVD